MCHHVDVNDYGLPWNLFVWLVPVWQFVWPCNLFLFDGAASWCAIRTCDTTCLWHDMHVSVSVEWMLYCSAFTELLLSYPCHSCSSKVHWGQKPNAYPRKHKALSLCMFMLAWTLLCKLFFGCVSCLSSVMQVSIIKHLRPDKFKTGATLAFTTGSFSRGFMFTALLVMYFNCFWTWIALGLESDSFCHIRLGAKIGWTRAWSWHLPFNRPPTLMWGGCISYLCFCSSGMQYQKCQYSNKYGLQCLYDLPMLVCLMCSSVQSLVHLLCILKLTLDGTHLCF